MREYNRGEIYDRGDLGMRMHGHYYALYVYVSSEITFWAILKPPTGR